MPIRLAIVLAPLLCAACSAPNPRFGFGGSGDTAVEGSDGAADETAAAGAATDTGESGTAFGEVGGAGPVLLFAGGDSNGSVPERYCADAAEAQALACGAMTRVLFDADADPLDARVALDDALDDPAGPIVSAGGVVVAEDLDAFVQGALRQSVSATGIVAGETVWSGLSEGATTNCSDWTSGKSERRGGAADTTRTSEWIDAKTAGCGERYPVLCLCRADD